MKFQGEGVAKAKVFKQKYGAKLEFQKGGGANQKNFWGGGGYGYLWNHTMILYQVNLLFPHNPKAEVVLSNSPYKSLAWNLTKITNISKYLKI